MPAPPIHLASPISRIGVDFKYLFITVSFYRSYLSYYNYSILSKQYTCDYIKIYFVDLQDEKNQLMQVSLWIRQVMPFRRSFVMLLEALRSA